MSKEIDCFYANRTTGKLTSKCIECYSILRKARYLKHYVEEKANAVKYRNLNPLYGKEYNKKYAIEHREEIYRNVKARHQRNPEKRKTYGNQRRMENIWLHLWQKAKVRAKRKDMEFSITKEEIKVLIRTHCPVLGIEFDLNDKTKMALMSLDRIDNSKGYISGNVEIISYKANSIKSNGSLEDFEKLVSFYDNLNLINNREYLADKKSKQKARRLLNGSTAGVGRRNISYSLTKSDKSILCSLIPKLCPVFGIEIVINNKKRADNSLSIDRIDNSKGYELGNLIFVSWKANRLKSSSTIEDLKNIVAYINKRKASLAAA